MVVMPTLATEAWTGAAATGAAAAGAGGIVGCGRTNGVVVTRGGRVLPDPAEPGGGGAPTSGASVPDESDGSQEGDRPLGPVGIQGLRGGETK